MLKDGFLILDKPTGISSAKAVALVKKALGCAKIGHGGTLDPLASGVLPLGIGEATKALGYVSENAAKEYRFTVTFGEERDTLDAEGKITGTTDRLPTRNEIESVLPSFEGNIEQVPPVYSALKIDGQRAYQRARAGEEVEMQARTVRIDRLRLVSCEESSMRSATFLLACGKGVYVRSLARDIARKVNSLGYVSELRRTAVGKFRETGAISLDKLPEFVHNAALFEAWIPIELALDDIPAIDVDSEQARKLRQGQAIPTDRPDGRYQAQTQGRIVALVMSDRSQLKPLRVFNL